MKKFLLTSAICIAALTAANAAQAQSNPNNTFEFEGQTWTITGGDWNGAPITANMMTPGFGKVCPMRAIKLVKVKNTTGGPKMAMTAEQKFRGDYRTHVLCDRGYVPHADNSPANAPAPASTQPQPQPRHSDTIEAWRQ